VQELLVEADLPSLLVVVSAFRLLPLTSPLPSPSHAGPHRLVCEDPLQGRHAVVPTMPSLLPVLQETYISLAQGPATCFVALALVVLDESLEVLLEVHGVVALHIQAKTLVVLEVLVVRGDLVAPLANESQDNIHLSKLQHIPAEVVPANPAVVAASRALGPFGPFWPFCLAAALHPFWASQVLVATFSSSVAFAPTPHP
jgi:hypothetical protein